MYTNSKKTSIPKSSNKINPQFENASLYSNKPEVDSPSLIPSLNQEVQQVAQYQEKWENTYYLRFIPYVNDQTILEISFAQNEPPIRLNPSRSITYLKYIFLDPGPHLLTDYKEKYFKSNVNFSNKKKAIKTIRVARSRMLDEIKGNEKDPRREMIARDFKVSIATYLKNAKHIVEFVQLPFITFHTCETVKKKRIMLII